ncbi:MAG: hypothetical protein SFU98_18535 [Leptospiraceae bacterium]|nr:hypothetical protein [Leptospiraceae bacterium]
MVKWILLFFLPISLIAERSFSLETLGYANHFSEDKLDTKTTEYKRNSNLYLIPKFIGKETEEKFGYEFGFLFPVSFNEKKNTIYSLGNSFLFYDFKGIQFIFGRKEFQKRNHFLPRDGVEGVKVEYKFLKYFELEFIAFDYYRAFPIFEFEFGKVQEDIENQIGTRSRHGLGLKFKKDSLEADVRFLYLNLGNWGKSSKDDARKIPSGDDDFIYHGDFLFSNVNRNLDLHLGLHFSRGLDKSISNPIRKERSTLISGEAISIKGNLKLSIFYLSLSSFLPDRDKRNEAGEVLETGYVAMGTNITNSYLITREINFYPSSWVTSSGFEKQNGIKGARRNSFSSEARLGLEYLGFSFSIFGNYFLPYLETGGSNGSVSISKKDFSKSFLAELGFEFEFKPKENFFCKVQASRLFTSKDISMEGSFVSIASGLRF